MVYIVISFCILLAVLGYLFEVRNMITDARIRRDRAAREAKLMGKIRELEEAGKNRDQ